MRQLWYWRSMRMDKSCSPYPLIRIWNVRDFTTSKDICISVEGLEPPSLRHVALILQLLFWFVQNGQIGTLRDYCIKIPILPFSVWCSFFIRYGFLAAIINFFHRWFSIFINIVPLFVLSELGFLPPDRIVTGPYFQRNPRRQIKGRIPECLDK